MIKKYIADSVLDGITINDELILELYKTKEFKRLARINHLGVVFFLYPMANHCRFEHSLGVYELTRRTLNNIDPDNKVNKTTRQAVLAAALLHDIGHGPFSHIFELISEEAHEAYSIGIINSPESDVYKVFEKINPDAREQVVQILKGEHELPWCNQLISSEVDMDRLDYLLRDAYSTGAAYGYIDWKWLINNARISKKTNELVFKEKAISVIESLILGRYHMNISVYWNPKNVANSMLYKFWFNRMKFLFKTNQLKEDYKFLEPIFENRVLTIEEFNALDDGIVLAGIRYSTLEEDKYIKIIANKFLNQEIPKCISSEEEIKIFIEQQDENLKEQTWTIQEINPNFTWYQKNHKFSAKIILNNKKIVVATEHSTAISATTEEKNSVKRMAVFI